MSIDVREAIADDRPRMELLLRAVGQPKALQEQALGHAQGFCLIAEQDGEVIGLLRCRRDGLVSPILVHPDASQLAIMKLLVDKALVKLRPSRVSRCGLRIAGQDQRRAFMDSARWNDTTLPADRVIDDSADRMRELDAVLSDAAPPVDAAADAVASSQAPLSDAAAARPIDDKPRAGDADAKSTTTAAA